jgi:hypothetical protein
MKRKARHSAGLTAKQGLFPCHYCNVCALGLGIAAHFSGSVEAAFWFVAVSMFLSGSILWLLGEETHPRYSAAEMAVPGSSI